MLKSHALFAATCIFTVKSPFFCSDVSLVKPRELFALDDIGLIYLLEFMLVDKSTQR